MTFLKELSTIIGMLSLAFVIIFLFSTPSMILAKEITIVGSDLHSSAGNKIPVRTKMDFGDKEKVQTFPNHIGNYYGVDCDTSGLTESLKADVMLMRSYRNPSSQIFLLILQSKNRSSFHPPTVCYPALGYDIVEELSEEIVIQNESWVEGPWREAEKSKASLKVKKLMVNNEKERRLVLYFYVKNRLLSDEITLIRVSALTFGEDEEVLNRLKDFTSEIFPLMFEYREEQIIAKHLLRSGLSGWITIGILFFVPIFILFYPRMKNAWVKR